MLTLCSLDLGCTETYSRREATFLGGVYDDRLGALTIVTQGSRRAGAKVQSASYAVERASTRDGWQAFLLSHTGSGEVYRVDVAPQREHDRCTCKAGQCKLECKHVDSLRELIAEGVL